MDMKNTTILLIFLLCVLGMIIGVHYTESSDSSQRPDEYEEAINEDSNETATTSLELMNNESDFNELLT